MITLAASTRGKENAIPYKPRPDPHTLIPLLYTDGLVEARNGKEEYGMKRLRETVAALGTQPALEMVQGIVNSVSDFTHGGMQKDDVTVVVKRTA